MADGWRECNRMLNQTVNTLTTCWQLGQKKDFYQKDFDCQGSKSSAEGNKHYCCMSWLVSTQGCCLTNVWSSEVPKLWMRATKVLFKEPIWVPNGWLEVFTGKCLLWLARIFLMESVIKSGTKLIKLKTTVTLVITRNMGQNMVTKSLCSQNSHYNVNVHHVCQCIVSLSIP